MLNRLFKNKYMPKILVMIFILLLIIIIGIIYRIALKNKYANEMIDIATENENAIFKVEKILIYSSAGINNSQDNKLQDLNICQYTDIAVYIDNKSYIEELNEKNSVSELYIDNIKIDVSSNKGERILNYKSALDFGKFKLLENSETINFNIIRTNEENQSSDYSSPSFFTDCSNPITIGYINKDFKQYSATENDNIVSYDGKILKKANIDLEDINCSISFTIHLKNNINEEFVYNASINNLVSNSDDAIYNGFVAKMKTEFEDSNLFFKIVK